jgi:hypothetical protein
MTYQVLNEKTVQITSVPKSFSTATQQNDVSLSVGASVPFVTPVAQIGTAPSLSSGSLILSAGSVWYLEGVVQASVPVGDTSKNSWVDVQWHDGTSYVGSIGRSSAYYRVDGGTTGRDEKAFALIDTTGGAVTVSLKVLAYGTGGLGQINDLIAHYVYAGLGRAVMIELEAP